MITTKWITGGPLFDGMDYLENGSVLIEDGRVKKVVAHSVADTDFPLIHTQGGLIMPGLVDLHSDSLERSIEKRKGVFFDIEFAILNLDRQLAACGITTFCHSLSFADDELGLRSPDVSEECVRKIVSFNRSEQSLINHKIHVRYEVGSKQSIEIIERLLEDRIVDVVSIMDHTPGQGQFKCMESYIRFHATEYQLSQSEIIEKADEKRSENQSAWELVSHLTDMVKLQGIPLLSHDDDTAQKVKLIKRLGVDATEFPVSLEAAQMAIETGLNVFMGAPNLIRNQSTNGNLKASDVIQHGLCTGLVSDYYPESLCQSAFIANTYTGSIESALAKVTSGPGMFLDQSSGTGTLKPGAEADLIIVDTKHDWVHVTHVFVSGRTVFQIETIQT